MLERRLANLQDQLERLYQQYDLETRFEEKIRLEPIIEDKERTIEQVKAQIEQASKPKPDNPDAPQVFISYGRDDGRGQSLAEQIEQRLLESGLRVFRDVHGLQAGDVWFSKLEKGLLDSAAMVLVVSEKARNSQWVFNEYDMAREHGIKVIPVLAEDVRKPLWLRHLQVLDFQIHQDWNALLKACPVAPSIVIPQVIKPTWASEAGEDQYGQFADLVYKDVTQRFRLIKAGTFMMGSPDEEEGRNDDETLREVTLTQDFWLADTACTRELWKAVWGEDALHLFGENPPDYPVEQVSWLDAQECIHKLEEKINISISLPSEKQWEYACRASTVSSFSFGSKLDMSVANHTGDRRLKSYLGRLTSVKSYPANSWGLYEMHGNIAEWCLESITDGDTPRINVKVNSYGVLRGGNWMDRSVACRSSARRYLEKSCRYFGLGFRLCIPSMH